MSLIKKQANGLNFERITWQHLNIRKKAMEQEFSLPVWQTGWSGLLISLSIAFFIVIISASILSLINHSIIAEKANQPAINDLALSSDTN